MKQWKKNVIIAAIALLVPLWCGSAILAVQCLAPDNGSGTVDLPADCPYTAPDETMKIIDGLPPGTTIELDPILDDFFCDGSTTCSAVLPLPKCETTGGTLGGNLHCFDATLYLDVDGTGDLAGFSRNLAVPMSVEIHTGPRIPGDPVQQFAAAIYTFYGQFFGDPDFDMFIVRGGTNYGLPSPGVTTLREQPSSDYAVDSFFDITYQIQFAGAPGSVLEGFSGTTTDTIRIQQGEPPATLCDTLLERYNCCIELQNAGRNLDYNDCKTYTDQTTCESNNCTWYSGNCMVDVCLTEVSGDDKVTAPDYSIFKKEFGRSGCPCSL